MLDDWRRVQTSVILGANPSAEEQEEALEEGASTVNNVVHSMRLCQTSFDKKSYLTYLKVSTSRIVRGSSHLIENSPRNT